ncbi:hypothetical protein ACFWMP_23185 [Paenibacillus sp. NPDC058367]|uniref:hypothetical protein n=1 Tax=Paenibacillus sp. NPDC058367 TaxID=3346460 RepID=UPI00366070C6
MKKLKWLKWIILAIFFCVIIYVFVGNMGVVRESIDQYVADETLSEITAGNEIGQSFSYDQNNLSGVSLKMATYMRNNDGTIQVGIREMNEENDIYQTSVKANSISDNEYFDFRFPPIKFSKGKEYYVYIKSLDSIKGKSVTAYNSSIDTYDGGSLYINGEKQNKDLTFKVFYNRTVLNYISDKIIGIF